MNPAGREIFWNIPGPIIIGMYAAVVLSLIIAAIGFLRRLSRWSRGEKDQDSLPWIERAKHFLTYAVAQVKLFRESFSGIMHISIFVGFLGLFAATAVIVLEEYTPLVFLRGRIYMVFSLLSDLAGLIFLVGISLAIYRRYVQRPEKLERRRGDLLTLGGLFLLAFTGFLTEAARIATDWPGFEVYSIGGYPLARILDLILPRDTRWETFHRGLWLFHLAFVLLFFAFLPSLRLTHILVTPFNLLLKKRPLGALRPVLRLGEEKILGAGKLKNLSWKQLLDIDACTGCGRCQEVCPAFNTEKPLSPMNVVGKLRNLLSGKNSPDSSPWREVEEVEVWNCTTCGACEEACPVLINHIDRLVELRRYQVHTGNVRGSALRGLEDLFYYGNPWGHPPKDRTLWLQDEKVRILEEGEETDLLYWVGCAGAYDPQGQEISLALVKLLKKAQVDFAILGSKERCCGDFARRMGEEGLFQKLARENIENLKKYKFNKILVNCPHGYNTLKNEYSKFAGEFEIIHYSELITQLSRDNKIKLDSIGEKGITFHDPCYLGRYNKIFDLPRDIIGKVPGLELKEMAQNRKDAFCCGGGGGHVLLDPQYGEGINLRRFQEAEDLGVEMVVTACPFCKMMLDLAVTSRDLSGKVKVKDLAEVIESAS
ncbi:MAG: (Fe-S)-binding protein [Deltaproteobacteria bacterium]|nr:MAG: (Fe-S)-binding protein [Deltaproteobacteria bacterium]